MVVHKKIRDAYNEYLKWFDNLGINREYIRETKIKNLSSFAQKLIDDDPELKRIQSKIDAINRTAVPHMEKLKKDDPALYKKFKDAGFAP